MLGGGVVLFFEMGGGVVLSVNPRTRKLNFDGQEEGEDTPMHIYRTRNPGRPNMLWGLYDVRVTRFLDECKFHGGVKGPFFAN
jgi:hypothetical protein